MKKFKNSNVGNSIKSKIANWNFKGKTAKNFDEHVSKSVPLYEWSHDIGLKVSDFFLSKPCNVYDLGCSTGTFIKKLSNKNLEKNIKYYAIDEIKDMCRIAKKKNYKNKSVKIINKEIEKIKLKKSSLITSFYTIQFLHTSTRQNVYNKIYKSLNWGGGFLLFEKVRAPDARFQDMIVQIYNEYKLDQKFSPAEIISKTKSLKGVLEPFSTKANIDMMKRAGFKDIVTIFKFLNFEGFLAIK